MNHLKISLSIFFLLLCTPIFTQSFKKGFIIQANGDTLHGLIRETSDQQLSHSVEFKASRKATTSYFSADDLKGFGFKAGDFFESHPIRFSIMTNNIWEEVAGQRFLSQLTKGSLSLYELNDGSESPLFIKKGDESLQLLCFSREGHAEYLITLQAATADCNGLIIPDKLKLEPYAVQSLVEDYNECSKLGKRHQVPYVQAWGFGGLSTKAIMNKFEGFGKGLAAELRPWKSSFGSRWTLGFDFYNLSHLKDYGYDFEQTRLNEFAVKSRFYLPAKNSHFSLYGLIGAKFMSWERKSGYHPENGVMNISNRDENREWTLQAGVGVHAQFNRHLIKFEVPFDRSVSLRLGYGIALWR